MEEISVEFTRDELEVLIQRLGIELPVGIDEDDIALPDDVIARLHASAQRALEARGVFAGGAANEAVSALLHLAAAPLLVVSVQVEQGVAIDVTYLLCDTDLGVQVDEFAPKCFRFTPFVTRDLVTRVERLTDLRPAAMIDVEGFSISPADLDIAAQSARTDPFAARDHLIGVGVPEAAAATFSEALATLRRTVAVAAIHRPEDDRVEGGTISWLDCGLRGNWWSEPTDDLGEDDQPLQLAPIAADAILAEVTSYLPLAFSPDADGSDAATPSA